MVARPSNRDTVGSRLLRLRPNASINSVALHIPIGVNFKQAFIFAIVYFNAFDRLLDLLPTAAAAAGSTKPKVLLNLPPFPRLRGQGLVRRRPGLQPFPFVRRGAAQCRL